ncbi:hypothetical protein PQX77_018621 [Marasmius sp. AFHP31]|nr:hypothetical protein PQX77_018621 [Marasmius sp. AFHP31]
MSSGDLKNKPTTRRGTRSSTSLRQSSSDLTSNVLSSSQTGPPTGLSIPVSKNISGELKNEDTAAAISEATPFDEDGKRPVEGNGSKTNLETKTNNQPDSHKPVRNVNETQFSEKPTLEASWEAIEKEMRSLEEGCRGGWKDDIDTLLVFAGLFSAVVTGFLVESYQWLEEAPEDTTVALLRQISQQMASTSATLPLPPFKPTSSAVRINVLWFLSLTIGLVVALIGLLCKQWIRELRRPTHTRSPSADVALILLQTWSVREWHVKTIVISLPMLLELALFLFFAGLLDLLHTRHPAPFVAVMVVVILTGLFYLVTTLIPTADFIKKVFHQISTFEDDCRFPVVDNIMTQPAMEDTCPYKSPQAWAVFMSFGWMSSHIPGIMRALYSLCVMYYPPKHDEAPQPRFEKWKETFHEIIWYIDEWPDLLRTLQWSDKGFTPSRQELKALRWFAGVYHDSPAIMPYLRTILESMPLSLVMPAVFSHWSYLPDRQWDIGDIDAALRMVRTDLTVDDHLSYAKADLLNNMWGEDSSYNQFLRWTHVCMNIGDPAQTTVHVPDPPLGAHLPFSRIDNLLKDPDSSPDGPRALGTRLWSTFMEIARNASREEACWGALMQDLAQYIVTCSPDYTFHGKSATTTASPFVESVEGLEFLTQMHKIALHRDMKFLISADRNMHWIGAMDIVRHVHRLPEDHFPPIPSLFPLSLRTLHRTLTSLSSTDHDLDFGYLNTCMGHWDNARTPARSQLVAILSGHINDYPKSATRPRTFSEPSTISPLVMSPVGLNFVAFVNARLVKERETYDWLGDESRAAWSKAVERVRAARPELPPDFFLPISHEGIDLPPSEHQPLQGAVTEVQITDPISPGPEDGGGGSEDGNETPGRPTASGLSPGFGQDEAALDNKDAAINIEEAIPMETLVVRSPDENQTNGGMELGGMELGGPEADKNV